MKEEWKKEGDKIIIEIPFWQDRWNPYMEEESEKGLLGQYPTLTGLIIREDGYDEIGFAYTIDMDYKDKGDQYTDIVFHYYGNEEDFIKLCKQWGIGFVIMDNRKNENENNH